MSAWTTTGEFPKNAGADANRPDTADSLQKGDEILTMPAPLPTTYTTYRSSMGPVNGEVGGAPGYMNADTPTSVQYARYPIAPLSAGPRTGATTFEEQRVAELEDKAREEDKKDLVRIYPAFLIDGHPLTLTKAVKLKVRLAKVVLRSINCACRYLYPFNLLPGFLTFSQSCRPRACGFDIFHLLCYPQPP